MDTWPQLGVGQITIRPSPKPWCRRAIAVGLVALVRILQPEDFDFGFDGLEFQIGGDEVGLACPGQGCGKRVGESQGVGGAIPSRNFSQLTVSGDYFNLGIADEFPGLAECIECTSKSWEWDEFFGCRVYFLGSADTVALSTYRAWPVSLPGRCDALMPVQP